MPTQGQALRHPIPAAVTSLAILVVAIAMRLVLDRYVGDTVPFVTLFAAVAFAVWVGGWANALLIALLGYIPSHYLFVQPRGQFYFGDASTKVGLMAYVVTCAIIVVVGEAMRRARRQADAQAALLTATLESVSEAVISMDDTGCVTYVNRAAEMLLGTSRRKSVGLSLDDVLAVRSSVDGRRLTDPAARAMRDGVAVPLDPDATFFSRTGIARPIDGCATPMRDQHGRVAGAVLVFEDVTERRLWARAESERLESARLLASIVASSDDAIISKSLDGTIKTWNLGAQKIFGYSPEEAIGQNIAMIFPAGRYEGEEGQIIGCLQEGRPIEHFETERLHKSGRIVRVSLSISPLVDASGNVVGASKIARDIAERHHATQRERSLLLEAAAANAKFRAFFEQGALMAWIVGLDGAVLEHNRLSGEGCGFASDQIAGARFWDGPWWRPSTPLVEEVRNVLERAAGGQPLRAEMPYFVAGGKERAIDLSVVPIKDEHGTVLFLAVTGIDITDRKRAEARRDRQSVPGRD